MKSFFCSILLSISITVFAQDKKHGKYVIIISVDGFRPEFYRDGSWPAPNLQEMAQGGVSADGVKSVYPSVTYPSHTTILTGALPATHGIYYNSTFGGGQASKPYWETDGIKVPTLWHAVKQKGLTSASVYWPVSVGAPVTYLVPEIWSTNKKEDPLLPIRSHAIPAGLMEEIEAKATGKLVANDLNSDYLRMDENLGRMAAYLVETYQPNLLTLHLLCVDHAAHGEGRDGKGVRKAVASADRAIGEIREAVQRAGIQDSTTILIVGDHGFADIHSSLSPNVLLKENGFIKDNGDWTAMFNTSGAAALLYLKDKKDSGMVKKIIALFDAQPAGIKKLFTVLTKADLTRMGADPAVQLAISPIEGIGMSGASNGNLLKPSKGGTHGFDPTFKHLETGFIAYGAGIKPATVIPIMGLQDIAPLAAALLKLDFNAPDGYLQPGMLLAK